MMAYYNNGFPATYTPYYTQVAPVQVTQQQTNTPVQGGLNWIQGEQAAKSYLVAPNSTVVLFDSESQTIYIKTADASGMPSMKVLDYTIRETDKNSPVLPVGVKTGDLSNFATKDEIKAVSEQLAALKSKVYDFVAKKKAAKLLEMEDEDDE